MKKRVISDRSRIKSVALTIGAIVIVVFVILPLTFTLFDGAKIGNVALIPIEGVITGNGASYLGTTTVSSQTIVNFIEQADEDDQIKVIVLEINSPGGSAVASDEIATAVKKQKSQLSRLSGKQVLQEDIGLLLQPIILLLTECPLRAVLE